MPITSFTNGPFWTTETTQSLTPFSSQGCPTGYIAHDGAFYKVYNQSKTYDQAREQCAADGGLLAMPKNKQLDAFLFRLKNALVGPGYGYFWFGLSDEHREGEWRWADGTLHNITADWGNWGPNQPEGCAHYYGWISEGWNSMRCDFSNKFICQLAHGMSPQVLSTYGFISIAICNFHIGTICKVL
ncbi:C-type lectin lectoxin-Lio3-like [Branchiostoma floridae x Branchiostoma belcheri]